MTYENHLRTALDAFALARPDVSDRRLSIAAGLNSGWISEFRASGAATFSRSQMILSAMAEMCPAGPEGDALRAVLARLDTAPPAHNLADGDLPTPDTGAAA